MARHYNFMSLKQKFLSAFRVMNFVSNERAWRALSAEADFQVEKEVPNGNILIIAPHPDDEIFGCSGALKTVDREVKVQIVYIFSGDERSKSKKVEEREEESKEAIRLLTNPEQIFFRRANNSVISNKTISQLAAIIRELKPEVVFLPSFSDPNFDHRETARVAAEALKIAATGGIKLKRITIWLYEIWSPLPFFNRLLPIDPEKKEKSMEVFRSQNKERNYKKAIRALNEYRGEIFGLSAPAEAFFALPADLLLKLYFKEPK